MAISVVLSQISKQFLYKSIKVYVKHNSNGK